MTAGPTAGLAADRPDRPMVPAMGGTRLVPAPDPIARDYLLLALRLDQHAPGLVDGYFGPADLKAQVDLEDLRSPARLREDAVALRGRLAEEVADIDRRSWLDAQTVALEAQARAAAGDPLPYVEHVERTMGFAPRRRPDAVYDAARRALAELLPGHAPLHDRLEAWDAALVVPVERVSAMVDGLVARFRRRAEMAFGLPDGEELRVGLVTGQPWSGYDWFYGGRRSRVDINTDLPIRVPDLVHTVAHETYPGHHLEHAWKEAELVDRLGRLEASILLIDTPECPVSEGLADAGVALAVPADEHAALLAELLVEAGLRPDVGAARAAAAQAARLAPHRRELSAIRGDAAFHRHADGWSHEQVLDWLIEVGGYSPTLAAKRLEFIEHPRWRAYVFVYAEGEALVRDWVAAVPPAERTARFGRLLREQLTPGRLLDEMTSGRRPTPPPTPAPG